MINSKIFSTLIAAMLFPFFLWSGQLLAGEKIDPVDIMRKSLIAFYYQGEDMRARVLMELINKEGKKRIRDLTMLRRNDEVGGEQKYFIYFQSPADVRRMTFMVWKYPERDDDRWIYIPAIDLVKRIASSDKRSSFVGSDFTYEDISGRDVESDTHSLLKEERLNGRDCYLIESIPKGESEYAKKVSWIDKSNFLPLREEYYDIQGELYKIYTSDEVKEIKGFLTVIRRTIRNVKSGHRTQVEFQKVDYNLHLDESIFTERFLRRPPRKWIG